MRRPSATFLGLAVMLVALAQTPLSVCAQQKFHPGHYIALDRYDDDVQAIRDVLRAGVSGVEKRYTWGELEPRPDEYDFSGIEADLAVLASSRRQLVVFVLDKSFKDVRFTPQYLWDDTLPVNSRVSGKGYVAKRWDPRVAARFGRLLTAIGETFDSHPRFEGIALQETALGIEDPTLAAEGYSATAYRDALIGILSTAAEAFPSSRVFWYANFLPRGQKLLADVANAVTPLGVAIGGPDVLPDRASLQRHVYPLLRRQPPEAVRFISAQNDSFRHEHADRNAPTRYWTPKELLAYAQDQLGVSYLFWNRVSKPDPADAYDIDDVYPVIAEHPLVGRGPGESL